MTGGKAFAQLIEEYGAQEEKENTEEAEGKADKKDGNDTVDGKGKGNNKERIQLMSEEERNRGAVSFSVYAKYLQHAGGIVWAPVILLFLALMQGASGMMISFNLLC